MSILELLNSPLTTIITVLATNGLTFLATKNTNKKDLTISERQLLSEDEQKFRAELREIIVEQKLELEETKNEIKELRTEIGILHETNLKLSLENKQLQVKVDELTFELKKFNKGDVK